MERFDDIVCDPRLRRDALRAHLAGAPAAEPYRGRYRVMSTSGSSGRPGVFAYDTAGWSAYVAQFLRVTALTGMPMWSHRGLRVGVVAGGDPKHASAQVAMTCSALGLVRFHAAPRNAVARADRRGPQRLPARCAARLRLLRGAARRRAARRPPADRPPRHHEQRRAADPRHGSPRPRGVRRARVRLLLEDRGTLGGAVPGARRLPPLRGARHRRERRRGQPAGAGRRARCARAADEPLQPAPAADPLRDHRGRHRRPRALPLRPDAEARQRRARPRRRRSAPRRRHRPPAPVRRPHHGSRHPRVPGRPARRPAQAARRARRRRRRRRDRAARPRPGPGPAARRRHRPAPPRRRALRDDRAPRRREAFPRRRRPAAAVLG